jgi:Tfp pilus assembly protein PilF
VDQLNTAAIVAFKMSQDIQRQSVRVGSVVFVTVLFLRIFVLGRLSASPFLLPSGGDMYFYNDWAQRILHGRSSDQLAFYGLPGYAYLLAFLYWIFGYNPFLPGLFQALLDSGTALLVYHIVTLLVPAEERSSAVIVASRVWPLKLVQKRQAVAFVAALGWGLFVPGQAYSAILMPTAWVVFSFWFVVWRVIHKKTALPALECLLLGLLIGITATAVATILFLIPFVLTALYLRRATNRPKQALMGATSLIIGVIAGTSPCWVRNYFIAHDPVILSAHSGINFWIGNNPEANGYPHFPPGLRAGQAAMLEDSIGTAEAAVGRPLKRSEVSAYWSNQVKNYIAQHPVAWSRLLLLKLRNVWSAFQYDDLSIVTSLRESGTILPGPYFGVIAALAFPGIVLLWCTSVAARWMVAAILLHVAALLITFVTERYRLAIVPGLLSFAAAGLFIFWRSLIGAQPARVAVYLLLLAAATIFTSWPQRNPALWALDAYNSGWQALEAGNLSGAEKKLLLARAYVPTNAETNFALGNLKLAQGEQDSANSLYLTTLQLDQNHRGALNNLGVMALNSCNYDFAENWFRRAEQLDPRNPKTHFLLATTLFAKGNYDDAQAEIAAAIALAPDQTEFKDLRNKIAKSKRPSMTN